jgi:Ca2+/Na+ antiporter
MDQLVAFWRQRRGDSGGRRRRNRTDRCTGAKTSYRARICRHATVGGITSLPEVTAVSTGAIHGNGKLAVSTLLGSLAFNIFILSLADASRRGPALSSLTRGLWSMLQGLLTIVALALVAIAISSGDVQIGGIGCWTLAILEATEAFGTGVKR